MEIAELLEPFESYPKTYSKQINSPKEGKTLCFFCPICSRSVHLFWPQLSFGPKKGIPGTSSRKNSASIATVVAYQVLTADNLFLRP